MDLLRKRKEVFWDLIHKVWPSILGVQSYSEGCMKHTAFQYQFRISRNSLNSQISKDYLLHYNTQCTHRLPTKWVGQYSMRNPWRFGLKRLIVTTTNASCTTILQEVRSHKKGLFLKHYTWNSTPCMFACCGLQRAVQRDLHLVTWSVCSLEGSQTSCYLLLPTLFHLAQFTSRTHFICWSNGEIFQRRSLFCKSISLKMLHGVFSIEKYISQTASRILASVRFPYFG